MSFARERAGVPDRRLRTSLLGAARAVVVALLTVETAACTASFPHSARPTTSLRLHGEPALAVVTIDEEIVGPLVVVAARGVALPEGTHQVSVEAPGYFPWDKLVRADGTPAKRIDLAVDLTPIPR